MLIIEAGAGALPTTKKSAGLILMLVKRGPRRSRIAATLLFGFTLLGTAGCNQKMAIQPKDIPLRESEFYRDGMSARPLPDGTVPRGYLEDDPAFYTGKMAGRPGATSPTGSAGPAQGTGGGQVAGSTNIQAANLASNVLPQTAGQTDIDYFPIAVTPELVARGQERFDIFCAPCHSRLGDGQGMIVKRGFRQPPSFHIDRLRSAPVGHFFDVMTNGFGAMPDYSQQVSPRDRWAIIAYIRALQLSQHSTVAEVPPDKRGELDAGGDQK